MTMEEWNPLLILSGAFAAGKTALAKKFVADLGFKKPVTATERPPREGEQDGMDYRFVIRPEFDELIDSGQLVEWTTVNGYRYGTPKASVEDPILNGQPLALCVDPFGVAAFKRHPIERIRDAIVSIYLEVDLDEAIRRAMSRPGGITPAELARRCETRNVEELMKHECQYVVPNPRDGMDKAYQQIVQIVARRRKEYLVNR